MKRTRLAPAPDAHGPLAVRVLTLAAERERFDALLAAEHFLGPRFPAGDRLYQVAEQDGQWAGLLLWCAPTLHLKDRDAWIGWNPLTRAQRLKLIVNQARFLIPDAANCARKNSAPATRPPRPSAPPPGARSTPPSVTASKTRCAKSPTRAANKANALRWPRSSL